MSASFLILPSSFPSTSQQQNSWTDCDSCLNYDAQTCFVIILPTAAAASFFIWLFLQTGHLAAGLVLAQLLAIVLLGVLAYLLAISLKRCWRRLNALLFPSSKCECEAEGITNSSSSGNNSPSAEHSKEAILV